MKAHIILIVLFILPLKNSIAQLEVNYHSILNNDKPINDVTNSKTSKSIIFFCPAVYISQESYSKKADELIKNSKMKGILDLNIHFIYFKQNLKSNAKGLKYLSKDQKDTLFIGQFECLFIGFDTNNLQRAKTKMKFNYDIEQVFKNENLFRVPIIDTNKCFEKIPDRIPFYVDFIKESISPNYSTDEKIQFLRDTINFLYSEISFLKTEINKINTGGEIRKDTIPEKNKEEVNSDAILNENKKSKVQDKKDKKKP